MKYKFLSNLFSIVIISLFILSLTACSKGNETPNTELTVENIAQHPDFIAEEDASEGLEFNLNTNGKYTVSIGTCTANEIKIPSLYKGVPVEIVEAFQYKNAGDGDEEFSNDVVSDVVIGYGAKFIEDNAFENCTALESIYIPNSVEIIGKEAFKNCHQFSSVIIPNGVKSVGKDAFINTEYYTKELNWVNSGLYIGEFLIATKKDIVTFNMKNETKVLIDSVFVDCTLLTSVTIPANVTIIGANAFLNCTSLNTINFKGTIEKWNLITKGEVWNKNVPATKVICSDGEVEL